MDLNYAPEDREFRAATRRWLEANVPKEDLKTLAERKAWHRKLYEAEYVGMLWPRAYGGWGATPGPQAIGPDEIARVDAPPPMHGLRHRVLRPAKTGPATAAPPQAQLQRTLTATE